MRVTRVRVHAPVTSFRHPFFVTGSQPSFAMPPPSTVHGHCASARGHWPDPSTFFFGIHFTFVARTRDLEHQQILKAGGKKKPEIGVQPVTREFLFDATMTLYLDPSLAEAFRKPVYPVVLGRSQDLAEIQTVEEVTLERPKRARIEHTLLPQGLRPCVRFGPTVLLTRHISEPPKRKASFAQYIVLHEPVFFGDTTAGARSFTEVEGIPLDDFWCDPTIVDDDGRPRAVWIHRLVD